MQTVFAVVSQGGQFNKLSFVYLYYNEEAAKAAAVQMQLEHMKDDLGANKKACGYWAKYHEILNLVAAGDNSKAYNVYQIWNKSIDESDQSIIVVHEKRVTGIMIESESKPPPGYVLADEPCKHCGKRVNSSESECWNCGTKEPTNRIGWDKV